MVAHMTQRMGNVIVAGSINVDLVVGVPRLPTAGRDRARRPLRAAERRQERQPGRGGQPRRRHTSSCSGLSATTTSAAPPSTGWLGRRRCLGLPAVVGRAHGPGPHRRGRRRREPDRRRPGRQWASRRRHDRGKTADLRRHPGPSACSASRSSTRPCWPPRAGRSGTGCASSSTRRPRAPCWLSCWRCRPS